MNLDCFIVIAVICFFQLLDIIQLREIKNIIKKNKE